MTCELPYIEDLTLESREEKDRLTNLHLDIAKRIYSHRVVENTHTNRIFKYQNNKMVVYGDEYYYKQALSFIRTLNNDLGFEGVKLNTDPDNPIRRFVSIDVRPDRYTPLQLDTQVQMETFLKHYLGDSDIVLQSEEFEDAISNHSEIFKKLTDSVAEKAKLYLNGLEKSGDYYKSGKTESDLRVLLGTLKDESTYGLMESISKYITMSGFNLKNIKTRLTIIDNKINNLSEDVDIRKDQLKEISDFVRHSSYFYHLFDLLDDMAKEFTTLGVDSKAIDDYERDILERDMKGFLNSVGLFSEDEITDFLNTLNSEINNSGNLFNQFKGLYKSKLGDVVQPQLVYEELENKFNGVLRDSLKPKGAVQRQLYNTLNELRQFKGRLKDLHYDTLTEIYYPIFEKSFKNKENTLTIDGTQTVVDKYKITKENFKTMLYIAEEDTGAIEHYGSAMINVSDTIATTVADFFKEVVISANVDNTRDINNFQDFLSSNKKQQGDEILKTLDKNLVHDNLTIDALEQVDDTYIPADGDGVLELTVLGIPGKYRARITRNYITEFNTIKYNNLRKVFSHHIDDVVDEYTTKLLNDRYSLVNIDTSDSILKRFHSLLYLPSKTSGELFLNPNIGRFLSNTPTRDDIKGKIKSMLYTSFFADNLSVKPYEDIQKIMRDNNVLDNNNNLVDLNLDENYKARKHTMNNTYWNTYKTYTRGDYSSSTLQDRFHYNRASLFGKGESNIKEVLVRFTDLSYGYVELINTADGVIIFNTSEKEIQDFSTYSREYSQLADKYNITKGGFNNESARKWNYINSDSFNKEYYDRIIKLYNQSNNNYGEVSLSNYEIPQVEKMEESSRLEKAKENLNNIKSGEGFNMFMDYASSYKVDENRTARMRDGKYINEDGEEVNDPVYTTTERQYINGQKIRNISAKFNRPIPLDKLETDTYKSALLYKTASNVYRALKDNESQALLLQTILEGDTTMGITPRRAKVRENGSEVRIPGAGVKLKEADLRSSKMMVSFINDYVYGISNEDSGIFGTKISVKKIANKISGYTAFTSLAWNVFTVPSNRIISLHNTRVVAEGNEFFNEQDWWDSIKIYNSSYGGFFNDYKNKGFTNMKSPLTQMAIRFNAIQGEFLNPNGQIDTKNLAEKLSDNALYWTQEIGEHANQIESMIMLMKGFKLPSGKSLWTAVEEINIDRQEGESLKMPDEFIKDLEIEFQKRLQGVNRQIHGNYSKLDKTMLQKGVITNMLMTFKKYIYDGFRSRFQGERWDQELKNEQEGYFRTYLKALNKEFSETMKTQGLTAALKSGGFKSIGKSLVKTTLGGWDAATFRLASKSNENLKKFLYGENLTERQYYAAMKATYDIGNIVRAMLVIAVAELLMNNLDDDDDTAKFFLSYVEIYAKKLEGDVGLFTSFTNFSTGPFIGGATLDQLYKQWKAPFAASRSIDNTTGIFKQLISFDTINEDGELEFTWHALDKYEKSGKGYEKGDYKIGREAEKSIFSPYYNFTKMFDPEEQLNYLNLLQKYSK